MYMDVLHNHYAMASGAWNINIHDGKTDTWQQLRKCYKRLQLWFHKNSF